MAETDFGLPANALQALRGALAKHAHVQLAIVYGSRAKGNYRPGSDIDITLAGSELTFSDLLCIETELADQMLPYKIDLSLLSHINNPALRDHIARVGKVLWQNPEGAALAMAATPNAR